MTIRLCGYDVIIDDEDFGKVTPFIWHVSCIRKGGPYFGFWTRINGKLKNTCLSRWIMGLTEFDGKIVDHMSGDTLDNRKSNLRICKQIENSRNAGRSHTNTTGFKGVCFDKSHNKYVARIRIRDKRINLGRAKTPEEAYQFYCEAAKKYHGEFARLE